MTVICYADGSCNNAAPALERFGGAGVHVVGGEDFQLGLPAPCTSSIAELAAVVYAMMLHPGEPMRIISDSQYVVKGAALYLPGWEKRGWRKSNGDRLENVELWQEIHAQMRARKVVMDWVKGHANVPGNERADRLAGAARQSMIEQHAAT